LPAITTTGDTNTGIFFPAADTIAFTEGGAEAMRINSSGNVGIGETNPTRKLDVVGTASATYFMMSSNTASAPAVDAAITRPANGALAVITNSSERMRIDSSGNVGIGTTTPSGKLHVAGEITFGAVATEGGQATFHNPDASTGMVIDVSSANNARIFNTSNNFNLTLGQLGGTGGSIGFYTANAERASINSTGVFSFNSGYGSSAAAYGCRAWVNFNGSGTPAKRGDGNITSITDNGTGNYDVNFATAMPDANYATTATAGAGGGTTNVFVTAPYATANTTSSIRIGIHNAGGSLVDVGYVFVAVFR
jgi:hypothetical protein